MFFGLCLIASYIMTVAKILSAVAEFIADKINRR